MMQPLQCVYSTALNTLVWNVEPPSFRFAVIYWQSDGRNNCISDSQPFFLNVAILRKILSTWKKCPWATRGSCGCKTCWILFLRCGRWFPKKWSSARSKGAASIRASRQRRQRATWQTCRHRQTAGNNRSCLGGRVYVPHLLLGLRRIFEWI